MSEHYGLWSKHVGWWTLSAVGADGCETRVLFSTSNRGVALAQLQQSADGDPFIRLSGIYEIRRFGPDGKPEEET